ncbi:hypothetical protein D3C86_1482150 [compost metagenome]
MLLAAREFDLVRQFVFGDGALLLDRQSPSLERGLICLLLKPFEGRGLQRAFQFAGGRYVGDADVDDGQAHLVEFGRGEQAGGDPLMQGADAVGQDLADLEFGQILGRVLLHDAGQKALDLFDGTPQMKAVPQVDAEVDAVGHGFRVADAPDGDALDRYFLEVPRAALEQERQFAVVHRQLGDRGAVGREPEGEAAARFASLSAPVELDVGAGVAAQQTPESE